MIQITGGTVITMDPAYRVVQADVWIDDSYIVHIGPWEKRADVVIQAQNHYILPGLVQPHVHLCQTLFRGMGDDLDLLDWLKTRIWPLEAAHDLDSVYASAQLGIAELLRSGTTTILDMETVSHTEGAFHALAESGIRAIVGKCLMDEPHPLLYEPTESALKESLDLADAWHGFDRGRIQYGFAPRFALSVTDDLWRLVAEEAKRRHLIVHTHVAESQREVQQILAHKGLLPLDHLHAMGLTRGRLVAAHGVWLTEDELTIVRDYQVGLVHCPSSNLKLASGIAPISTWQEQGISFGIGADGAPCNNRLDGFEEMRLAALLQKPLFGAKAMPARTTLTQATLGGAQILGLDDRIGSIEVGKQADLIMVSRKGAHHQPVVYSDPYSQIVYQAKSDDVTMTMVAGRVLYQDGQWLTLDEERVIDQAEKAIRRVADRANIM